jgi:hypothetical protein
MMAEPRRRGGAMLPLIIVGATLFAFGIYQSTRPKEVEVNKGYEGPAISAPANPSTMQAPDAPPLSKDDAARAAQATETTLPAPGATKSVLDQEWFQALRTGDTFDFRGRALAAFKAKQDDGTLNCSPVLTSKSAAELAQIDAVTCLAKDGSEIKAEFEDDYQVGDVGPVQNDGEISATAPNKKVYKIQKSGDEFNATTQGPG